MTIASHHQEYKSHNALTIQNSKMVARNVPALPEQQVLASTSGTRVTVRDLFGFMPVRVKQRAIEVDRLGSAKNFDHLVSSIIALLAAWTKAVMVTIRDAGSRRTMSLQSSESASRLAKLLTQADIIEEESLKSWVSLGASAPGISVSGCISLKPVATKRLQFISLGVRPLLNEHSSILYDEVNRVFAESTFGVVEQVDNEDTREKAKKSIDRWPVFYLRIDLGMDSLDNDALLDGSGHNELGMTTDLLRMMAYEFLRKHHYQPRAINAFEELRASRGTGTEERSVKRRRGNKHGAASPSDTRASHQASPFTSWARVKPDTSGRVLEKMPDDKISSISASLAGEGSDGQDENLQAWKPLFTPSGKLVRAPFEDEEPPDEGAGASTQETQEAKTVTWVDPSSKKRTVVDGRTGFMVKASGLRGQMDFSPRALPHLPSRVFKAKEPVIPRIPDMPEGLDSSAHHNCQEVCGVKIGAGGATLKALEGRISKDRLRKAEVIGQVDHKFILANVSSASGSMLVLIDQHAADERCRVEDLMRRYFGESGADTEILEKPLQFELSIREGQLLRRFREHFLHWGVSYDVVENITGKNACSVEVQALPPSIVERCRLEPRLLVELLRMESWRMCDHPGTCEETVQGKDWVARFHRCPEGIQELINSRACRSMFVPRRWVTC